jgi:hypothetical protein
MPDTVLSALNDMRSFDAGYRVNTWQSPFGI